MTETQPDKQTRYYRLKQAVGNRLGFLRLNRRVNLIEEDLEELASDFMLETILAEHPEEMFKDYKPPKTLEELKSRVEQGERYFHGSILGGAKCPVDDLSYSGLPANLWAA